MKNGSMHRIIIGDSRHMDEVKDTTVHLVITSPPYWQLKDYGAEDQIGFNDSYQDYIDNLNKTWKECHRILHPGCRLCVNIGDQFARAILYGRYKVIPIRTEIIKYCESIGFDYMGAIIWQKVTTCQTTGGATVMGSYPYPRSGIIKIDYEFILVLKKLGKPPKVSKEVKEKSKLSNEEWNQYFNGHWNFSGERQNGHIAMFPLELPRRLIKMFSFYGDTVLDPFLGSGTTSKAALELGRDSIGYEINKDFLETIKSKIGIHKEPLLYKENFDYEIIFQKKNKKKKEEKLIPSTNNNHLERLVDPKKFRFGTVIDTNGKQERNDTHRVVSILKPDEMILDSGLKVKLLGVIPIEKENYKEEAVSFLSNLISGNRVFLKYDNLKFDNKKNLLAYVYLKNKTFLNAKLITKGLAKCNRKLDFRYKDRFERYEEEAKQANLGVWGKKGY
ncbi:MAG: thermonuclease family protein [Candidatus Omnitrophica bacterium]|nr:thermonuclease family protein [Candidatus Omnitrophota bacterium]